MPGRCKALASAAPAPTEAGDRTAPSDRPGRGEPLKTGLDTELKAFVPSWKPLTISVLLGFLKCVHKFLSSKTQICTV